MKKKSKKKSTTRSTSATGKKRKPAAAGDRGRLGSDDWPRVGRSTAENNDRVYLLAQNLKSAREKEGLTLSRLARELDVAPATLIKFEDRGHGISIGVVAKIAERLGCQLDLKPRKASRKKR